MYSVLVPNKSEFILLRLNFKDFEQFL